MKIDYGLSGQNRKVLVQSLERMTGQKRIYEGTPKFGYHIGAWYIDKNGALSVPSAFEANNQDEILRELEAEGFAPLPRRKQEGKEALSVSMPLEDWTDSALSNLQKLIKSKASLIKKALQCESLEVKKTDERLSFPWFSSSLVASQSMVYASFIDLLCKMAKSQTRVTAKERVVENEKYAMRCFLLRLGMIGDGYRETRKLLLKNLSGNSAFKNPKEKKDAR